MRDGGTKKQSLLVRNLDKRISPDQLKEVFGKYGEVRDVYMPRDHYTREPRGFAFVEFLDERDALDAQDKMDKQPIDGREVTIVFAQERRKTPDEMRGREDGKGGGGGGGGGYRGGGGGGYGRGRSPPRRRYSRSRSPPRRRRSYSPRRRSPSPRGSPMGRRDRSPPRRSPSPRRD